MSRVIRAYASEASGERTREAARDLIAPLDVEMASQQSRFVAAARAELGISGIDIGMLYQVELNESALGVQRTEEEIAQATRPSDSTPSPAPEDRGAVDGANP